MNIKKVIASSLLVLNIIPSIHAMNSCDFNVRKKSKTNAFLKRSIYSSLEHREISTSVRLENVNCPNGIISKTQLSDIHNLVISEIAKINSEELKCKYGAKECEIIALGLWDVLNKKSCDNKLRSFWEIYLITAEALHYLSRSHPSQTMFNIVSSSDLIGDLNKKSFVSFEELRVALIESLKRVLVDCL